MTNDELRITNEPFVRQSRPSPFAVRHSPIRVLILSLLLFLPISCGRHKLRPGEIERNQFFAEILRRENRRFIGEDGFFKTNLLVNPYPEVQKWCAMALGRIGNPQALPWLYQAARTGDAAVRATSAFAIGEIEDRELLDEKFLPPDPQATAELVRLLDDPSLTVQMRAAEALGKIGSASGAAEIIRRLERFSYGGSPAERAYLELSIAALMRLKDPAAIPVLEKLAEANDPEIQWHAVNALIELQDKGACPLFVHLLNSPNSELRAYAARGLGVCGDPSLASLLLPLLPPRQQQTGNNPISVRFCALQALSNLKNPAVIPSIRAALEADPIDDAHPDQQNFAIHAAATLGSIGAVEGEAVLLPLLKCSGPVANDTVIALAKILKGNPERFWGLIDESRFTNPAAMRAWAQAMEELGGRNAADELHRMLVQSAEKPLAMEIETLPSILASLAKLDPPGFQETLLPFLGSHNAVLMRAAVAAYRPAPRIKEPWAPVVEAFEACPVGSNTEARIDILKHLTPWISERKVQDTLYHGLRDPERSVRLISAGLLRRAGVAGVSEDPGPSDSYITEATSYALAATRKNRTTAILETARGAIEIELFSEDAPVAASIFVSMARRGVYNGLEFTRAAPFFLIEGGDYYGARGVSGRAIPCEINMRPFERGSVGMTLEDKDSGTGRFFITLAPQPQLDGMHTCFGRVISGMQTADKIIPGDRIKRILIKEDSTFFDYRRY